jgi:ubiquinone/menaquinone biosynthesis C-methylase UbiE
MLQSYPNSERAAWERGYRRSGRKYGGAPPDLPSLLPGARVLEAGCGDGKSLLAMPGRGWEIVATDFSREAIRISSGHQILCNVGFIQADARALPFRRESFDAVFLYHLLGHIPGKGRSLVASETERILVPGGAVFLRVFSVRDFRKGSGDLVEPNTYLRGDGVLTHYFLREEIESLFPGLILTAIRDDDWSMKVRGVQLIRSEIVAHFRK